MNTGNELTFVFNKSSSRTIFLSGGPLSYNYTVYELKIHLGTDDSQGSEHKVANMTFPLEVSWSIAYVNISLEFGW